MGFGKAKATAGGILPEFSKFYCHPGRAGGSPFWISGHRNGDREKNLDTPCCIGSFLWFGFLLHANTGSLHNGRPGNLSFMGGTRSG